MQDSAPAFSSEVARIRAVYDRFDNEGVETRLWAPFDPVEAAYRVRQTQIFSKFMAETAGWPGLEGKEILDVGCGTGRHLRQFIDQGASPGQLHGTDIREAALAKARMLSPNIGFRHSDGCSLDFESGRFDIVTQHVVFSSIGDPALRERLAGEMMRVLRPGGFIFWWDMLGMARDAGGGTVPLDPHPLFPGMSGKFVRVGLQIPPSESLRPLRGLTALLRPWLDRFGSSPTHLGALFGPKTTASKSS